MRNHSFEYNCYYQSPVGLIKIIETGGFLIKAYFVEQNSESENSHSKIIKNSNNLLKEACKQLDEYFEGKRYKFDLALKPNGTDFQRSAWESLLRIPYGETRNYRQQAESIFNPKAMRAVGQANARNPIPIIIPCHRVIGKKGFLTGYSGGLDRKTRLLAMEHRFMDEQNY